MDSVTQPVGRASVPRTLDDVRRYLIARDRGIDSARPAAFEVEQADVAGFRLVTFRWEWPGPTRPDAPRPDGFVMWTELASTLAVGFPRTTGVQLPLAARSHQILLPPGMVLRAGIQTFRTVHRTVEYGELVQPEDWLVSALDMAPAGTTLDWGSITGTLSDQTDLQAALDGKLDDAQLSDEEYNAATWDGVATVAPSKNAVRDALQGMLGYINTYTWQPGDEVTVPDEAYGSGWNGSLEVPTKNAVYDKIESLSAGGGMTWTEVTGTTQAAAVNTGYVANNASLVTVTLPATAAVGDIVRVVGKGAGKWRLGANTGQTIKLPWAETTSGGTIDGQEQYAAVEVVCITANTTWVLASSAGGLAVA